jgi:hypothetical protein
MDCGIDRQPTMWVRRARVVIFPGWIAAIIVGLFLIVQQLLLFLSRSCNPHSLAHAPVALASCACPQASRKCRPDWLGVGDALVGRHAAWIAVSPGVRRGFADGSIRGPASSAGEDAGSTEVRTGSADLAIGKRIHGAVERRGALPFAGACHAVCARWARGGKRLGLSVADVRMRSIKVARAWRENSRFHARCKGAGREETLPLCADCLQFAIVLYSTTIDTKIRPWIGTSCT